MPFPPELKEAGLAVLIEHAKRGDTLTYKQLNIELGTPIDPPKGHYFVRQIGLLCDDLNARHLATTEHEFMISVLVRTVDSPRLPGDGFFRLAERLGRLAYTDDINARRSFVSDELEAIYAAYRIDT
ncbi:hypothetical protein [Glycomyces buryatensis]|uniref:Uncharacterized protein n=1 Tax=Glycomyces buryatensis TaxID=2570927 RepID=A0A4S8QEF8_9ACTN|nr:hypothetical protein [Glycomyces buryatensis]THV42720.1 hypothetical protein FAB82_04865 [Glycomyces buryatensis]